METTLIKIKGTLHDSKVMLGGITLLNPYRRYLDGEQSFTLCSRIPNLESGSRYLYLKAYDGRLGSSSGEFAIEKTEIIGGSIVITYKTSFSSGSYSYTDPNTGDVYLGRQVRTIDENSVPWRVDIIGEDIDLTQPGSGSGGYNSPFVVDADQILCSTIPQYGVNVRITGNSGAIKTSWFRDNESLVRFVTRGNVDINGTIMDFVAAGKTIGYMDFTSTNGIKGNMKEFLDALSDSGVKNHTIEMHITSSAIIQNVYRNPSGVYSGVFAVDFDNAGVWNAHARNE